MKIKEIGNPTLTIQEYLNLNGITDVKIDKDIWKTLYKGYKFAPCDFTREQFDIMYNEREFIE